MQVVGRTAWNKNVQVCDGTLGGSEDVSEAEADLVPVPGPQGRRGDGHPVDVLDEPDDKGGVEQALPKGRDVERGVEREENP